MKGDLLALESRATLPVCTCDENVDMLGRSHSELERALQLCALHHGTIGVRKK